MNRRTWILILAVIAFLPGCKKYDEGPLMSLYSKGMRVAGTWYFQRVTYGDRDSTASYTYQRLEFIFSKKYDGGAFSWNHNLMATSAGSNPLDGGTWEFISDKDSLAMVLYKNQFRDTVSMRWKINRLAYTECWLERDFNDSTKLNWQLVKYVY